MTLDVEVRLGKGRLGSMVGAKMGGSIGRHDTKRKEIQHTNIWINDMRPNYKQQHNSRDDCYAECHYAKYRGALVWWTHEE